MYSVDALPASAAEAPCLISRHPSLAITTAQPGEAFIFVDTPVKQIVEAPIAKSTFYSRSGWYR